MKTTLPLSIDVNLKQRLSTIKEQTGIPISRIIHDMLNQYLPQIEKKHNIQLTFKGVEPSGISKKTK